MVRTKHFENLVALLGQSVVEKMDEADGESTLEAFAFTRVAADWLGYELEDSAFSDGKGDQGIDFWSCSEGHFKVFQVKSHEIDKTNRLVSDPFDHRGVDDLRRILGFLETDTPPAGTNEKAVEFYTSWRLAVTKRDMAEQPEPLEVLLGLVIFGHNLTEPAKSDFENFQKKTKTMQIGKVPIELRVQLYTLDDLIAARWLQDNREWKDKDGKKRDKIDLYPEIRQNEANWIRGTNSALFYCRAIDLISAFGDFGYQIFEPNVRAHIRKSRVNDSIIDTLEHPSRHKEFRFLNNGITMTCKHFENPKENLPAFRVHQPGIVNGLQTVVAMHQAYLDMPQRDKESLKKNCYVLVRLLREKAVDDVNRVVLATNTQNPMQPRNLKSNTEEQILYERLFAKLGWFYERKQGAWEAFRSDPKRWRTLRNVRKSDFYVDVGVSRGRKRPRRVDNEDLAQCWLSFIGLSNEAVHQKRYIFEDDNLYRLAFLVRTKQHCGSYGFDRNQALGESITGAPAPELMLVSYLARQFAWMTPLSARDSRNEAMDRLGISPKRPREEIDAQLLQDHEFIKNRALRGMSYLFVDFLGYILFGIFGPDIHKIGHGLLKTTSLKQCFGSGSAEPLQQAVREESVEADDLLVVAWFVFDHIVTTLLGGGWKESYLSAVNRSRFNYSRDTRLRFFKEFTELEKFMEKTQVTKIWAVHIKPQTNISTFFRSTLQKLAK